MEMEKLLMENYDNLKHILSTNPVEKWKLISINFTIYQLF